MSMLNTNIGAEIERQLLAAPVQTDMLLREIKVLEEVGRHFAHKGNRVLCVKPSAKNNRWVFIVNRYMENQFLVGYWHNNRKLTSAYTFLPTLEEAVLHLHTLAEGAK